MMVFGFPNLSREAFSSPGTGGAKSLDAIRTTTKAIVIQNAIRPKNTTSEDPRPATVLQIGVGGLW